MRPTTKRRKDVANCAQEEGELITTSAAELVGNWSWTVWLLIPLTLALALLTALVLGPLGEPTEVERREGGVTRFLARRDTTTDPTKEAT
jgi:hypothetical protein